MDSLNLVAWSLAGIGFFSVALIVCFILFLTFEDTFRRIFNCPKRIIVPVTDERARKPENKPASPRL